MQIAVRLECILCSSSLNIFIATACKLSHLIYLFHRKIHLHRKVHIDSENCLPGVSIAKPLCSAVDPNLTENLSSYFELDYPVVCDFLDTVLYIMLGLKKVAALK